MANHAVWTLQFCNNSVGRIDPRTGRITATALPARPVAITAGAGSVWVWVATAGDDELWRIAPATRRISGSFLLGATPSAIAAQPGAVWVAAGTDGLLERIAPPTGNITAAQYCSVHVRCPQGPLPAGRVALQVALQWP